MVPATSMLITTGNFPQQSVRVWPIKLIGRDITTSIAVLITISVTALLQFGVKTLSMLELTTQSRNHGVNLSVGRGYLMDLVRLCLCNSSVLLFTRSSPAYQIYQHQDREALSHSSSYLVTATRIHQSTKMDTAGIK